MLNACTTVDKYIENNDFVGAEKFCRSMNDEAPRKECFHTMARQKASIDDFFAAAQYFELAGDVEDANANYLKAAERITDKPYNREKYDLAATCYEKAGVPEADYLLAIAKSCKKNCPPDITADYYIKAGHGYFAKMIYLKEGYKYLYLKDHAKTIDYFIRGGAPKRKIYFTMANACGGHDDRKALIDYYIKAGLKEKDREIFLEMANAFLKDHDYFSAHAYFILSGFTQEKSVLAINKQIASSKDYSNGANFFEKIGLPEIARDLYLQEAHLNTAFLKGIVSDYLKTDFEINELILSADNQYMVAAGSGELALIDFKTGKILNTHEEKYFGIENVSISANNKYIGYIHSDEFKLLDIDRWAIKKTAEKLGRPCLFTPDGEHILARKNDSLGIVAIESGITRKDFSITPAHLPFRSENMALSADGKHLVTCSVKTIEQFSRKGVEINVWDFNTGRLIRSHSDFPEDWRALFTSVKISQDNNKFAVFYSNQMRVYNLATGGKVVSSFTAHDDLLLERVHFVGKDKYLLLHKRKRDSSYPRLTYFELYDLISARTINRINSTGRIDAFAIDRDDQYLFIADCYGQQIQRVQLSDRENAFNLLGSIALNYEKAGKMREAEKYLTTFNALYGDPEKKEEDPCHKKIQLASLMLNDPALKKHFGQLFLHEETSEEEYDYVDDHTLRREIQTFKIKDKSGHAWVSCVFSGDLPKEKEVFTYYSDLSEDINKWKMNYAPVDLKELFAKLLAELDEDALTAIFDHTNHHFLRVVAKECMDGKREKRAAPAIEMKN